MTFIPDTDYNARVAILSEVAPLLNIPPCPFAGCVTEDQIKAALGERFDIWPESIIPHLDPEDRPAPKKVEEAMTS